MPVLKNIRNVIAKKEGEVLEEIFQLSENKEFKSEYLDLLIELLDKDWHHSHEDIARELQRIKSTKAIEVLHKTIYKKHNYLAYNNSAALARKCIWALADIGTDDAKKVLIETSLNNNIEIAFYAKKRLERWEIEKERKGNFN